MTKTFERPKLRLTLAEANRASAWRFNCGPGALCAVLNLTPDELRPHLGDFESKGYTNPTLMLQTLERYAVRSPWEVPYRRVYRSDMPIARADWPKVDWGLVRVQSGGKWTRPGVPMRARYRQTHWVAMNGGDVFDINAIESAGWISFDTWYDQLMPWLQSECCPEGDGTFWPTHALEVETGLIANSDGTFNHRGTKSTEGKNPKSEGRNPSIGIRTIYDDH